MWKHWTVSGHAEEEYSQLHLDTLGTGSVGMPWWGGEQGFIPSAPGGRWGFPQSSTRGVMYTAINQSDINMLQTTWGPYSSPYFILYISPSSYELSQFYSVHVSCDTCIIPPEYREDIYKITIIFRKSSDLFSNIFKQYYYSTQCIMCEQKLSKNLFLFTNFIDDSWLIYRLSK